MPHQRIMGHLEVGRVFLISRLHWYWHPNITITKKQKKTIILALTKENSDKTDGPGLVSFCIIETENGLGLFFDGRCLHG